MKLKDIIGNGGKKFNFIGETAGEIDYMVVRGAYPSIVSLSEGSLCNFDFDDEMMNEEIEIKT